MSKMVSVNVDVNSLFNIKVRYGFFFNVNLVAIIIQIICVFLLHCIYRLLIGLVGIGVSFSVFNYDIDIHTVLF